MQVQDKADASREETRKVLRRVATNIRVGHSWFVLTFIAGIPLVLLTVIVWLYALRADSNFYLIGLSAALTTVTGTLGPAMKRASRLAYINSATMLDKLDNSEAIGPLVEALWLGEPATQQLAAKSLARLLPRLKAGDDVLLSAHQKSGLYRVLAHKDPDITFSILQIAVLKALEHIGEESACAPVEKLSARPAKTPYERRVQKAANECVPFLQARLARRKAENTLVRASYNRQVPSETLLRPVSSSSSVEEAQQLLRGSSAQTENPQP